MKQLAIKMIRWYQTTFSGRRPSCRYHPTCSNYAIEAYQNYNFFYATFLTIFRLLRCNPLFKGGYDPIPKYKKILRAELKAEREAARKKDDATH
jgi:uncharacterized protein